MKVEIKRWKQSCEKLFTSVAVSEHDAKIIADAAVTADIRGVTSHGAVRLLTYRNRITKGIINSNPQIKIAVAGPSLIKIDGDNGLGQVVTDRAVDEAIKQAKEYGLCCASIRNTNHMGMLSYYALKATSQNMIACIMTNTPPFVAAIGGVQPAVGTNPICWGVPGSMFPVILDMAISPARGKIKDAADKGLTIPEGWAIDRNGNPTTNAKEALDGVLLPIAGVKGYGLGIIVEILSAILSGSAYGSYVTHPLDDYDHKPDLGNFILIIDVEHLMPVAEFKERLDDYIKTIKSAPKSPGVSEIFLPGEIEYRKEVASAAGKMEVDEKLYNDVMEIVK